MANKSVRLNFTGMGAGIKNRDSPQGDRGSAKGIFSVSLAIDNEYRKIQAIKIFNKINAVEVSGFNVDKSR